MADGAIRADLHLHTTASDGVWTSSEAVREAVARGFTHIAVTDHDSASGVEEAVFEGKKHGLSVVTGIELSAGQGEEVHLLGYGFDTRSPVLRDFLRGQLANRQARMERMLEKLRAMGIDADTRDAGNGEGFVGRMNLSYALVSKGYASSPREAFDKFLQPGRPAYVPRERVEASEGIGLLKSVGALVVLAHPGRLEMPWEALAALLPGWIEAGLDGIEAYHSSHNARARGRFDRLARRNGLLVTGGSDSHGRPGGVALGAHLPDWPSMQEDVQLLTQRLHKEKVD